MLDILRSAPRDRSCPTPTSCVTLWSDCLPRLLDDGLRRGKELLDRLLHLGAREWRDVDLNLVCIREKLRVFHRRIKRLAQDGYEFWRRFLRDEVGALKILLADNQLRNF